MIPWQSRCQRVPGPMPGCKKNLVWETYTRYRPAPPQSLSSESGAGAASGGGRPGPVAA